jgi:uncharacterized protein YejL (UPF0352 family)
MDKEYEQFLEDIVHVMKKHKVHDLVVVFQMDENFRNAYLTAAENPHEFYTALSDNVDQWVKEKIKEYG